MDRPIIGIIGKISPKFNDDLWQRIRISDELRYLIIKNGGTAISILPTNNSMNFNNNDFKDETPLTKDEINQLYRQIDLCDGFILQGGLYNSSYEIEIAKKIIELDKPLIGICAGFNNILRALGSDVAQDKFKTHDIYDIDYRHNISIIKNTIMHHIFGCDNYRVNSIHSMIATKELVEPYAKISSFSDDGLIESFELKNKKFILGIKWHPELMIGEEYVDRLFRSFILKCKEKGE